MLTIRAEQMEAFRRRAREGYVEGSAQRLRAAFHDQTRRLDDDSLRDLVRRGVDYAYDYDVSDKENVYRFLERMITDGEFFFRGHEKDLLDPSRNATQKMDALDWKEFRATRGSSDEGKRE